jgi:ABC-type transport system involved in multi-copper enzyme maturation permease subunit
MFPGPLFWVELVSTARRRRYFWLRVAYTAIGLFLLWSFYEGTTGYRSFAGGGTSIQQAARAAAGFFTAYSWFQLIALLLVAPAMAVGTIATERERRTIEYLFASDLTNTEIVVGKALARLLLIGQLLLAGVPLLMLFRVLGGIPTPLIVASTMLTVSTTLLLTSVSTCISVWSPRARDATVRVYAALAVLLLMPLWLGPLLIWLASKSSFALVASNSVQWLLDLNPLYVLGSSTSSQAALGLGVDLSQVTKMAIAHCLLAAGGIVLATAAVRRVHLREVGRGEAQGVPSWRIGRWLRAPATFRAQYLRPQVGNSAMIWKEVFAGHVKMRLGIVGRLAILILVAWVLFGAGWSFYAGMQYGNFSSHLTFVGFSNVAIACLTLIFLAVRAAGLITQEKESDTWLSLIATPLTASEIYRGKTLGNLYAARGSLLLMVALDASVVLVRPSFVVPATINLIAFSILGLFVSHLGLWFSLRSATTMRSMGLTLLVTLVLGGGYLLCCCPVAAMGPFGRWGDESVIVGLAPCIPFLLAIPTILFDAGAGREEAYMPLALMVGLFGYGSASILLALEAHFDHWAGRNTGRPDVAQLPAAPSGRSGGAVEPSAGLGPAGPADESGAAAGSVEDPAGLPADDLDTLP